MLAARDLGVRLPLEPPWWLVFDATLSEMEDVGKNILFIYTRALTRPELPITEKQVEDYLLGSMKLPLEKAPVVEEPMLVSR